MVNPTEKDDGVNFVGPPQDPSDFLWIMTEEPHRSRRMAIMKAHPEVRSHAFIEQIKRYMFNNLPFCSMLSPLIPDAHSIGYEINGT